MKSLQSLDSAERCHKQQQQSYALHIQIFSAISVRIYT